MTLSLHHMPTSAEIQTALALAALEARLAAVELRLAEAEARLAALEPL